MGGDCQCYRLLWKFRVILNNFFRSSRVEDALLLSLNLLIEVNI